ncbi:hypothetical protein BJX61DRAFT_182656 [Aspergillus egyptiacus]|nr:hypothetical protein BJX61DRAFT_182656 [Aspergillus egyptiacus]
MFKQKGLKEFDLFRELYACPVSVVHRLNVENMSYVLRILDDVANRKLMQKFQSRGLSVSEQEAFNDLTSCLEQLDPETPIPGEVATYLQNVCDAFGEP